MPPATATGARPRGKKIKKKKGGLTLSGGGGGIKIKPFAKPPSLPANFYDKSTATLLRALGCVLREEPLYVDDDDTCARGSSGSKACPSPKSAVDGPNPATSGDANDPTSSSPTKLNLPPPKAPVKQRRPMSREELYRLVEDLVTHNFGPKLYGEVVQAMDEAALTCLRRLVGVAPGCVEVESSVATSSSMSPLPPSVMFNLDELRGASGGAGTSALTVDRSGSSSSASQNGSATAVSDAVLFNVDRVCASYYEYLRCVRSVFLHLDRRFVFVPGREDWKSGGAVLRGSSSIGTTSMGTAGSSLRTWSLWDVGMACLRGHMSASGPPLSTDNAPSAAAAAAAAEARLAMTAPAQTVERRIDNAKSCQTILSALTTQTVSTLLRSLDSISIDSTLTRSVIRTIGDLGSSPSKEFLFELVATLTAYFDAECRRWVDMSGVGGSGDVVGYLRHVDSRLKQIGNLASFYLGGIGSTEASSSSPLHPIIGDASPSSALLLSIVDKHLLRPHYNDQHILHSTVLYRLLDDESRIIPDIKRLYTLGKRVDGGIYSLRSAFGQYGRQRGLDVVRGNGGSDKDARLKIIPSLLSCKSHLEELQIRAFGNDEAFGRVVRSVLEEVCNAGKDADDGDGDGGRKVAELLAKFVDLRFKNAKAGGGVTASAAASAAAASARTNSSISTTDLVVNTGVGATTESEMETFQTAVLSLFRHIHSKDVFEAFYKRDLAKRLLLNKSVSLDAERALVSKLKAECGGGYTAKMEGMFKDVELSRDVMANYTAHLHGISEADRAKVGNVEMDVQVLTTGYWPVYPQYPNLVLPPSLVAHKHRFESYYGAKYQGRRVAWQHALGNCIVRANFPKISAPRDLVVSLCQALVLLCFNVDDGSSNYPGGDLTIVDVMKKSGLDDRAEAERVLQSLSLGRDGTRVLVKSDRDGPANESDHGGNGTSSAPKKSRKVRRSVSDYDVFKFNKSFTSNQRRIRITNVQMKETSEERSKTHEAVSRDRLYLIDATVVRIMKARKTLEHRALMGEIMAQLKFPASSADIKKRIESLIEREYMERAEGDRSRYNYLA